MMRDNNLVRSQEISKALLEKRGKGRKCFVFQAVEAGVINGAERNSEVLGRTCDLPVPIRHCRSNFGIIKLLFSRRKIEFIFKMTDNLIAQSYFRTDNSKTEQAGFLESDFASKNQKNIFGN